MHVKICGLTSIDEALACIDAGAAAIGLNFVPASPRCVTIEEARRISDAVGARALVVGVVADLDVEAMRRLRDEANLGCLQLHGDESPAALEPFLPHAYKALRVATAEDVARADDFPGEHLLVDARVEGMLGGTGHRLDPKLVEGLAKRRRLTLAGGLRPDNVAAAIAAVQPFAVDVASGVEVRGRPRNKDLGAVAAFIAAARSSGPRSSAF